MMREIADDTSVPVSFDYLRACSNTYEELLLAYELLTKKIHLSTLSLEIALKALNGEDF